MIIASILQSKGADVSTVRPEDKISGVIQTLKRQGIGALVLTDGGSKILGIISERDIIGTLAERGPEALDLPVGELATMTVQTCAPGDSIEKVMSIMTKWRIRHLPVVENDKLVGIVSIGDVVKYRLDEIASEAEALREYMFN